MDIQAKLGTARTLLNELGNALTNLVNVAPEVFEDPELKSRLEDFRQVYDEAIKRLAKPSLRIATIGTTSSGKSTIVNALIGRRIAPIEAGEMSGGVLRIEHSEDCCLKIHATEGAVWETGEWKDLSDDEIYSRIQAAMHIYHQARRKKDYIAPQIEVNLPILPACDRILSGLPKDLGVELVDLPGLKSVQDQKNLEVIQPLVGKAFSLVALDYLQVDEEHRHKLLNELKEVVQFLQGRTESMIFILNRVDNHGSDDLPLDERVEKLRQEIKETLSLSELPDIIPFNARLLYYAQCAWGHNSLNSSSNVSSEIRLKLLKALVKDCASKIEEQVSGKRELRRWFDEIKYDLDDNHHIDDEKVSKIVEYAIEWSGGKSLWDCIKLRLEESFNELIILPTLINLFNFYDSFSYALNIKINTSKITNINEVKDKQLELINFRQKFPSLISNISDDFDQTIKFYIKTFKSKDVNLITRTLEEAKDKGLIGIQNFSTIVKDIEIDLMETIINPIRDAFNVKDRAFDLKDKLGENIAPYLAEDIAREYDYISLRLNDFEKQDSYLIKRAKVGDTKKLKELEHNEKYVRLFYQNIKSALISRSEYVLQAREKDFLLSLESLIDKQLERLTFSIEEEYLEYLDIENVIMSDIRKELNQNFTKLPENFFNLDSKVQQNQLSKNEKTGKQAKTMSKEVGSCLDKKTENYTIYVDKYEDIQYKQLQIPNTDMMAKQWADGIENSKYGKNGLWDILFEWSTDNLKYIHHLFENSLSNVIDLVERLLKEQLEKVQLQELELEKFAMLEDSHTLINDIRQKLAQEINN